MLLLLSLLGRNCGQSSCHEKGRGGGCCRPCAFVVVGLLLHLLLVVVWWRCRCRWHLLLLPQGNHQEMMILPAGSIIMRTIIPTRKMFRRRRTVVGVDAILVVLLLGEGFKEQGNQHCHRRYPGRCRCCCGAIVVVVVPLW